MITDHHATERSLIQKIGLILGPCLFLLMVLLFDLVPGNFQITAMAAIAILMAVWWITEAIPLAATALLPLILYPLSGIMSGTDVAPLYFNSTIVLFLGGFLIALTMERWLLHKRIALWIIRTVGGGPRRILLGFMLAAAFLSMWISNTATALMMLPIGLAVIHQMEQNFERDSSRPFVIALLLGIAYACSVGGMATLIGTPPNLSFSRIFQITFEKASAIEFGQWLMLGLPLSITLLFCIWLLMAFVFCRPPRHLRMDSSVIESEYRALGSMTYEQKVVFVVFGLTALLWIFRTDIQLGVLRIPGWSSLTPFPKLIDDGTVAMVMALSLFIIPTHSPESEGKTLASPDLFLKLPWHIVLLFGGGFALASGFQATGLANYIGEWFVYFKDVHPLLLILGICLIISFLTELTSNTATTEMVLPILASLAVSLHFNPLLLMIPATLSASCAFMMPVATPPNAIIFGSGKLKIYEMARVGVTINVIGALIITALFYTIGSAVFDIIPNQLPDWAILK